MPTTEELLRHFERQAALPWRDDLAPEYRVWVLHYDPALERRIKGRMAEFEAIARRHGVQRIITVSPLGVERLLRREGFRAHRAGPPMVIGGHPIFACWIEVDSASAIG